MVTPKGDTLEQDFISPLARPFYILNIAVILGFFGGAWRLHAYPLTRDLTTVVLLWNVFNFFVVAASLGALYERHQRRSAPRMPLHEPGWIVGAEGIPIACTIDDVSAGGARILIDTGSLAPVSDEIIEFVAYSAPLARNIHVPCRVRALNPLGRRVALGLSFQTASEKVANDVVAFAFGDSARWTFFQQRRHREFPFWTAIRMLGLLVREPVSLHLRILVKHFVDRFSRFRGSTSLPIVGKETPFRD
jgi:cellulose synthase (UDP-forming)